MNSPIIQLSFVNKTGKGLWIWTEPQAYGLEIPAGYEYKIITDETELRFEFKDDNLILWFENKFGCKVLKRKIGGEWEIDIDTSDIRL